MIVPDDLCEECDYMYNHTESVIIFYGLLCPRCKNIVDKANEQVAK